MTIEEAREQVDLNLDNQMYGQILEKIGKKLGSCTYTDQFLTDEYKLDDGFLIPRVLKDHSYVKIDFWREGQYINAGSELTTYEKYRSLIEQLTPVEDKEREHNKALLRGAIEKIKVQRANTKDERDIEIYSYILNILENKPVL